MTETIPGGAYKGSDGRWHDANGKPLPSSAVRAFEEKQADEARKTEEAAPAVTTVSTVTPPAPQPMAVPLVDEPEAAPAPRKRGGRRS